MSMVIFNLFALTLAEVAAGGAYVYDWGEAVREKPDAAAPPRPWGLRDKDWVNADHPVDVYWRKIDLRRDDATRYPARASAFYTLSATAGLFFERDLCRDPAAYFAAVFARFRRRGDVEINVQSVVLDKQNAFGREFPGLTPPVDKDFVAIDFTAKYFVREYCLDAPCLPDCEKISTVENGLFQS